MRPFASTRLAAFALLVAVGLGLGAAAAGAGVRDHGGGHGGHWVDDRCKQPGHRWKWYCQPTTTTTTKPPQPPVVVPPSTTTTTASTTTTTATAPSAPGPPPPKQLTPAVVTQSPAANDGGSSVAFPVVPEATPPAAVPAVSPVDIPGVRSLFDDDSGGVPLSMALVIAVSGLATVALVLRGTFGRGPQVSAVHEADYLKFR